MESLRFFFFFVFLITPHDAATKKKTYKREGLRALVQERGIDLQYSEAQSRRRDTRTLRSQPKEKGNTYRQAIHYHKTCRTYLSYIFLSSSPVGNLRFSRRNFDHFLKDFLSLISLCFKSSI